MAENGGAPFVDSSRLLCEDGVIWPSGRFVVCSYAATDLPPDDLITSVRCVVTRPSEVLVIGAGLDAHVVPGGRRERGESLEDTVRREVIEETGWSLGTLRRLGYVVYRHLDPRAPDYTFPYPVFVQVVYTAAAAAHHPDAMCPDDNDGEARFLAVERALDLPMAAAWRAFLRLAVTSEPAGPGGSIDAR
ncbi:MAG: NUDIX hydrolase [Dehalococcoidia bacterium]